MGSRNVYFGTRVDSALVELLKQKAQQDSRTISATLNLILADALRPQKETARRKEH